MKITELLTKHTIKLNIESKEKENVIDEMVTVLDKAGKLNDRQAYKEAILNRESQSSTGIGEGIAIPHAKTASVINPAIAFGRSKDGVDYESLDGQPAHLVFMIDQTGKTRLRLSRPFEVRRNFIFGIRRNRRRNNHYD